MGAENGEWNKYRFKSDEEDPRPVKWPPPAPFWFSGFDSNDATIVVAYAHSEEEILSFWPDAYGIDVIAEESEILFYDRFPRPEWWEGEGRVAPKLDPVPPRRRHPSFGR